jgi:hypothetical protein
MSKAHRRPEDAAHDVLAAEEFGMPAPDPVLHHGPVTLPADPTGIAEPHDVLAAEEFAMPAPRYGQRSLAAANESSRRGLYVVLGAVAFLVLRRLVRDLRA